MNIHSINSVSFGSISKAAAQKGIKRAKGDKECLLWKQLVSRSYFEAPHYDVDLSKDKTAFIVYKNNDPKNGICYASSDTSFDSFRSAALNAIKYEAQSRDYSQAFLENSSAGKIIEKYAK